MLLRGLGHQNDGDSLAARGGRERARTPPFLFYSVAVRVSHSISFPRRSLYPTPPTARLSILLLVFLALDWHLFPHLRPSHSEFCVPVLTHLPFFFPCAPRISSVYLAPSVSPLRVKFALFFIIPHVCRTCSESSSGYATLCVPCHGATWNLFCEFDVLDIAASAMEKRYVRGWWYDTPRSYKKGVRVIFLIHLHISHFSPWFCAILCRNYYLNEQYIIFYFVIL